MYYPARFSKAGIAQLVEQLTCNQQVAGSIPAAGSVEYERLTSLCRLSSINWLGHFSGLPLERVLLLQSPTLLV
jgi:hypothetical protein